MEAAARGAGRDPDEVRLVAVSKLQPPERIVAALESGHRVFGENYVQEAKNRWPALRERYDGIELHLIGPLQTNKTAEAVALFDVIQSLDREKLARSLVKERDRQGKLPRLLVQVNTGEEPQKAGILPEALPGFLKLCQDELSLHIEGLMAIPPDGDDVAPHTALLAKFAARHGLRELSIGMSADYEPAIRFGATIVRVGSAIFGARPPKVVPAGG
jgi:pyridoxal phosphate enzyme (YggS family)